MAFSLLSLAGCRAENTEPEVERQGSIPNDDRVATDDSAAPVEASSAGTLQVESPGAESGTTPTSSASTADTDSSSAATSSAVATEPTAEQSTQTTATSPAPTSTTAASTPPTTAVTSSLPSDTHPDIVKVESVKGRNPGGDGWKDSYSVGEKCYCATTFDHNIGGIEVDTPVGTKTVREVCEEIGDGPGPQGRPIYNDIQCGNGPANDAGDEDDCPGRVDIGRQGCGHIGPKWDLTVFQ